MQAPQRFSGIDAELTGEQVAGALVGGERLCLPAAAVQRQHELAVQPLPQRMVGGQLLQFGSEGIVAAQGQVGVDPGLEGGQPQFLQAGRFGAGERVVGQVSEYRAAPPGQRLAQRPSSLCVPARLQRRPSRGELVLEPRRIQVFSVGPQQVTAALGH